MMCRPTPLSGSLTMGLLLTLLLCTLTLCSAASLQVNDDMDRWGQTKPWLDAMQRDIPSDAYMTEFIARLRALKEAQDIGLAQKRGLDFGLGRGFSGSQAAKHMMGLAAANYAGGPGRRRRSASLTTLH